PVLPDGDGRSAPPGRVRGGDRLRAHPGRGPRGADRRDHEPRDLGRGPAASRAPAGPRPPVARLLQSTPRRCEEGPGRAPRQADPRRARGPGPEMSRIAIVGAGVSGLVAAAELERAGHEIDLFEAAPYAGGHTNTIDVESAAGALPVDTGFIVFNELNY